MLHKINAPLHLRMQNIWRGLMEARGRGRGMLSIRCGGHWTRRPCWEPRVHLPSKFRGPLEIHAFTAKSFVLLTNHVLIWTSCWAQIRLSGHCQTTPPSVEAPGAESHVSPNRKTIRLLFLIYRADVCGANRVTFYFWVVGSFLVVQGFHGVYSFHLASYIASWSVWDESVSVQI